jgi:hypothetical protein
LATALHVVGADQANLVAIMPRSLSVDDYQDTTDPTANTIPLTIAAVDTFRDIVLLELPVHTTATPGFSIGSSDEAPTGTEIVTWVPARQPQPLRPDPADVDGWCSGPDPERTLEVKAPSPQCADASRPVR